MLRKEKKCTPLDCWAVPFLVSRCPWFRNHPWFQNRFLVSESFLVAESSVLVSESSGFGCRIILGFRIIPQPAQGLQLNFGLQLKNRGGIKSERSMGSNNSVFFNSNRVKRPYPSSHLGKIALWILDSLISYWQHWGFQYFPMLMQKSIGMLFCIRGMGSKHGALVWSKMRVYNRIETHMETHKYRSIRNILHLHGPTYSDHLRSHRISISTHPTHPIPLLFPKAVRFAFCLRRSWPAAECMALSCRLRSLSWSTWSAGSWARRGILWPFHSLCS